MSDIEQILDDQINQIESQVSQPPEEDHAWEEGGLPVIDELDQETATEMWQTTAAYTEEYSTKAANAEPTEAQRKRWSALEDAFRRHPRSYHIADCPVCDWVRGGWITKANADNALHSHRTTSKH